MLVEVVDVRRNRSGPIILGHFRLNGRQHSSGERVNVFKLSGSTLQTPGDVRRRSLAIALAQLKRNGDMPVDNLTATQGF